MYAQCPECLTYFRLKPSHLKAAQGRVRCSRCKHVFNALETLQDDLSPGEIAAVREARQRDAKADEPPIEDEQVGDLFDGLDYTENAELKLDSPEETFPGTGRPLDERDAEEAAALSSAAGPLAPEREMQPDQLAHPMREMGFDNARPRRRHPVLLALANLLLLLVLGAQLVHWQRETLLEHPVAGPWLSEAYARIGLEPAPPRDLAAMKVSRTDVGSHAAEPGALYLTAVIENSAAHPQPWPQLRVDLEDRWGETVGARYFEAPEYLRNPAAAEDRMPPGRQFAIALAIVDPGNDAVGFQVEPCFANGERHVCAAELNR